MYRLLLALLILPLTLNPQAAFAKGDGETRLTRNRIEIAGEVLFESGSAQIQAQSHVLLAKVAKILKENPDLPVIRIAGHTDAVGEADANKKLSARRAKSVQAHLVSLGVPADRLETVGHGESKPRAFGKSPAALKKNRRVDFVLVRPLTVSTVVGLSKSIASGAEGFSGTVGIQVGATGHYAVMDALTVDLGAHYAQRGAKTDEATIKLSYIDIPLTTTYTPSLPALAGIVPNVGGGMLFSLPIGATVNGESTKGAMQTGVVLALGGTYEIPLGSMWFQTRYTKALKDASADFKGLKVSSFDLQLGMTF
jgi:hypothetical protein